MALTDIVKKLFTASAFSLALHASGCSGGGEESRGCRTDYDCRGDRICHLEGYCYDPRNPGRDSGVVEDAGRPPGRDAGTDISRNAELEGKIVFSESTGDSRDPYSYEIFTINADGSNIRQLTSDNYRDSGPSYSPDGRRIAFVSYQGEESETGGIYFMNADGTNKQSITLRSMARSLGISNISSPRWSPDGLRIVFSAVQREVGNQEIYVMNADGRGSIINLTNTPGRGFPEEFAPDWSPDGRKIAYMVADAEMVYDAYEIYVMNSDGSDVRRLTRLDDVHEDRPSWSPDGRKIAFCSDDDPSGAPNVYIMDSNGGNLRRLTDGTGRVDCYPVWSPDGSKILYSGPRLRVVDVHNPENKWDLNIFGYSPDWTP